MTGVLLGALVAGETLTPAQLAGILLVLGGILAASWTPSRPPLAAVEREPELVAA